jgi:hypothetical protein
VGGNVLGLPEAFFIKEFLRSDITKNPPLNTKNKAKEGKNGVPKN